MNVRYLIIMAISLLMLTQCAQEAEDKWGMESQIGSGKQEITADEDEAYNDFYRKVLADEPYIGFFRAEKKCIKKVDESYKKARRRFFLGVRVSDEEVGRYMEKFIEFCEDKGYLNDGCKEEWEKTLTILSFVLYANKPIFEFAADNIIEHRGLVFAEYPNKKLELDLFLPKQPLDEPVPCVVCIHGGGWRVNRRIWFEPFAKYLASKGLAAVTIDYRMLPAVRIIDCVYDSKAAVRWVRANAGKYGIDPDRIGALGASAGAHIIALLATTANVPELEGSGGNTGVSSAIQAAVGFATPAFKIGQDSSIRAKRFGLTTEDMKRISPYENISASSAPLYLVHGTKDRTVNPQDSQDLYDKYKEASAHAELKWIPDKGHDFYEGTDLGIALATEFFKAQFGRGGELRPAAEPAEAFSFEDAAVALPSPASVQLDPEGRLGERFQGNINYLRYLHDGKLDGRDMFEAYDTRHYAPGKFLELVWDREYAGKWLDAATRTAVNTGNDAQLTMVDAFAASLRRRQQPDGYMGIKLPTDRDLDKWEQDWDLWNQWNAMNGLLTHYELRGDRDSLEAASQVGEWIAKTYSPIEGQKARFFEAGEGGFTNVVVIGQLVRLYRHTGSENLIEFVRQVIQHFEPIQRMRSSGEPERGHGYMLSAILGGTAEFAQVTQDRETLTRVEQVWERMASDHLFPTGSLGSGESLHEGGLKDKPDAPYQETCATTEWIFFTQSLYAITGRAKYADALEQTCYNALLAAQSADGMKWCYFTPLHYHKDWFHGPTKCCYWSGPRGIARLPQLIYAVKGDIIYVNFFETSHATLAARGGKVHVAQDSEFPEIGRSRVTIQTPPGWKGTLRIRVPAWTTEFQVHLNGEPAPKSTDASGYCDINLPESTKHQVEIRFAVPFVREEFAGGYLVRRGPEVLSIDVRDNIETSLSWVSFPAEVVLQPADSDGSRRRYRADLEYASSGEPRGFMFTPYADAGNDGAAFRTVFRLAKKEN